VHLAIVVLVPATDAADRRLDPHLLIDALWAAADPTETVEHISALMTAGGLHVGLYLRAENSAAADRLAHELLERATATLPLLHGWRVRPPTGD
jgi:hypothetical protein